MGLHLIRMPDLGEGIAEVELVAWHVKVGDAVVEDQVLADVMTDKATVEIPSSVNGRVLSLGGEVGQVLAVGAELIRIETEGDDDKAAPAKKSKSAKEEKAEKASTASATSAAVPKTPQSASTPPARSAPPPAPKTSAARAAPAAAPHDMSGPPGSDLRALASPAVRARAWELGIDLAQVRGSARSGRIMQVDLDTHLERGAPRSLPAEPGGTQTRAQAQPRRAAAESATAPVVEKMLGLRRKIAQKMQESKRRIPHYSYVEEVDVSEVETLRAQLNTRFEAERGRLTLLPFIVRAMVVALREFGAVNATFDDEAGLITRHAAVHVGIATQTDAGLMVPVLRDAQSHDLWANAAEIARLAQAARGGKIVRDELVGSTITLTSLGRLGGIASTPVINHPEVAIVGVNRIVERAVIRAGQVQARQMMNLSSSFDHRVVDGTLAAEFVQSLRRHLEHPALLFVEQGR